MKRIEKVVFFVFVETIAFSRESEALHIRFTRRMEAFSSWSNVINLLALVFGVGCCFSTALAGSGGVDAKREAHKQWAILLC